MDTFLPWQPVWVVVFVVLLIPLLLLTLHWRQTGSGLWRVSATFSTFLLVATIWLYLTLPIFDFVDRCRPPGTGVCLDGRSFESVHRQILSEQLLGMLILLGLGTLLTIIFYLMTERKKKS